MSQLPPYLVTIGEDWQSISMNHVYWLILSERDMLRPRLVKQIGEMRPDLLEAAQEDLKYMRHRG